MAEWRPVVGYEGRYEVSDDGQVRSFVRSPEGRLLKPWVSGLGHKKVALHKNGRQKSHWVHQLVAAAFIGPKPKSKEVRHMNGDGGDNRVNNLRYGTPSENNFDRVKHGTHHNTAKTHCVRGHEFTSQNTGKNGANGRLCITCNRERARAYYHAKKGG